MNEEAVRRLSNRLKTGVALRDDPTKTKDEASAQRHIRELEQWAAGAVEDAKPFYALHGILETLNDLGPDEQRALQGTCAFSFDHAKALIEHQVRLFRIQKFLERIPPISCKKKAGRRDYKVRMERHLTMARKLHEENEISMSEAARQTVKKLGEGACQDEQRAVDYIRQRMYDTPKQ